jgi:hypothetical protein
VDYSLPEFITSSISSGNPVIFPFEKYPTKVSQRSFFPLYKHSPSSNLSSRAAFRLLQVSATRDRLRLSISPLFHILFGDSQVANRSLASESSALAMVVRDDCTSSQMRSSKYQSPLIPKKSRLLPRIFLWQKY